MTIPISSLDHLVLTVADLDATVHFYTRVLGMEEVAFGQGRRALKFGSQKINLHPSSQPLSPHAAHPSTGSADLCLLSAMPLPEVISCLEAHGIPILEGPVQRTGANGPIRSIYIRDPDLNLIEIANPLPPQ